MGHRTRLSCLGCFPLELVATTQRGHIPSAVAAWVAKKVRVVFAGCLVGFLRFAALVILSAIQNFILQMPVVAFVRLLTLRRTSL